MPCGPLVALQPINAFTSMKMVGFDSLKQAQPGAHSSTLRSSSLTSSPCPAGGICRMFNAPQESHGKGDSWCWMAKRLLWKAHLAFQQPQVVTTHWKGHLLSSNFLANSLSCPGINTESTGLPIHLLITMHPFLIVFWWCYPMVVSSANTTSRDWLSPKQSQFTNKLRSTLKLSHVLEVTIVLIIPRTKRTSNFGQPVLEAI